MRPQRSRMAYYGSNSLNNSANIDDPENYTIPTYSAFNGRGVSNLLKDFYQEIRSLKGSRRVEQEMSVPSPRSERKTKGSRRTRTEQAPLPETESVYSEPDILDRVETMAPDMFSRSKKQQNPKSQYRRQRLEKDREKEEYSLPAVSQNGRESKGDSMTNDRILLELMNIKERINLNDHLRMQQPYMYPQPQPVQQRSLGLEDKMLEMLMKMSLQQQQPQQPIIIQSPQQPPQPEPPRPYYQPPRRPEYSPEPRKNEPKYTSLPPPPPPPLYPPPLQHPKPNYYPQYPPAPKKNMKYVRRRLRKIFWAVAFPFLLKKYSTKLILVRKQYMINNLSSVLIQGADLIKEWFITSSAKAVSMLKNTINAPLDFHLEEDESLCDERMKKIANLLDMTLNSLQDTSKVQITQQFLPFISVTCDNRSFIHQNFVTNKELQYISFSQQHKYQFLDSNLQLIQIILFVFIKIIVYDILFQPWRVMESWNKEPLQGNLKLLGYILYYCTQELLNQKLKDVKPKGYSSISKKGVDSEEEKRKVEKNFTWDKLTYLDGVLGKECVEKIREYRNGDFWNGWKRQILKVGNKLHKEMVKKRKIVDKVFKELEVKFEKGSQSRVERSEESGGD